MKFIVPLLLAVFFVGCFVSAQDRNKEYREEVLKRASFEMGCKQSALQLIVLKEDPTWGYSTVGVKGCGKRLVYKRINMNWVLNSSSGKETKKK